MALDGTLLCHCNVVSALIQVVDNECLGELVQKVALRHHVSVQDVASLEAGAFCHASPSLSFSSNCSINDQSAAEALSTEVALSLQLLSCPALCYACLSMLGKCV